MDRRKKQDLLALASHPKTKTEPFESCEESRNLMVRVEYNGHHQCLLRMCDDATRSFVYAEVILRIQQIQWYGRKKSIEDSRCHWHMFSTYRALKHKPKENPKLGCSRSYSIRFAHAERAHKIKTNRQKNHKQQQANITS